MKITEVVELQSPTNMFTFSCHNHLAFSAPPMHNGIMVGRNDKRNCSDCDVSASKFLCHTTLTIHLLYDVGVVINGFAGDKTEFLRDYKTRQEIQNIRVAHVPVS